MSQLMKEAKNPGAKYPGVFKTDDGSAAVVTMETAASEAAGAYPITPSTQMGEGWASAVARGQKNVNGRQLIFFEPEGEHAAAGVTAGMSMVGLRSTNFSSGQGIAYMHESLYAAVGKRLTYVLNVACRAMTKHSLNVHAGHDDYHCVDDTGFFQIFAKDVQSVADLNLIIAPGGRTFIKPRHMRTGRLPDRPTLLNHFLNPSGNWSRNTWVTRRTLLIHPPVHNGPCLASNAVAYPSCITSISRPCWVRYKTRKPMHRASPPSVLSILITLRI